jgi:hypothetical protein
LLWVYFNAYIGIKPKEAIKVNLLQTTGLMLSIWYGCLKAFTSESKNWSAHKVKKSDFMWKFNIFYFGIILLNAIAAINSLVTHNFKIIPLFLYNIISFIYILACVEKEPPVSQEEIIKIISSEAGDNTEKVIDPDKLLESSIAGYKIFHLKTIILAVDIFIVFYLGIIILNLIEAIKVYSGLIFFWWLFSLSISILWLIQMAISLNIYYKSIQQNYLWNNGNNRRLKKDIDNQNGKKFFDGGINLSLAHARLLMFYVVIRETYLMYAEWFMNLNKVVLLIFTTGPPDGNTNAIVSFLKSSSFIPFKIYIFALNNSLFLFKLVSLRETKRLSNLSTIRLLSPRFARGRNDTLFNSLPRWESAPHQPRNVNNTQVLPTSHGWYISYRRGLMNHPAASCEVSKPEFLSGTAASRGELTVLRLKISSNFHFPASI